MEDPVGETHEVSQDSTPKLRDDVRRNSWWMNKDGNRIFVVTRLAYGNGSIREPDGYEVFERGNPDSPLIITVKVWNDMVDRGGIVRLPPRLIVPARQEV